MHKLLTFVRSADQVVIRHLAILLAAITAFLAGPALQRGAHIQSAIAGAAILNFTSYLAVVHGPRSVADLARVLSPIVGIASWGALTHLTGGAARSPFVAGFWLEIVVSARTFAPAGICVVTALGVFALWFQEIAGLPATLPSALYVQSVLMVAMGAATFAVHRSWRAAQQALSARFAEQSERLHELGQKLEDARVLGMSENVARLGHALKNSVHSLRGFVRLVEPGLGDRPGAADALVGLRTAIDQLELLAADTLSPRAGAGATSRGNGAPNGRAQAFLPGTAVQAAVEEAAAGLCAAHPAIRCVRRVVPPPGVIPITRGALIEVLSNLCLNAAEAMNGQGVVTIEAAARAGEWELRVIDEGPGIALQVLPRVFRPRSSTKPGGNGIGLYLNQRLVEDHGGRIAVESSSGRGASVSITFPIITAA